MLIYKLEGDSEEYLLPILVKGDNPFSPEDGINKEGYF